MSLADELDVPAAPPRRRWRWLVAGGGVLVVVLGLLRWHKKSGFNPGATVLGQALGLELPSRVASLAQARNGAEAASVVEVTIAHVTVPEVRGEMGNEASARLLETLAAARTVTVEQGAVNGPAAEAFLKSSGALGQALLDKQLPYFLDGDIHSAGSRLQPLLLSFYVERDTDVVVGEQTVRALRVWRLDQLSLSQSALGYTRRTTPAALVLLDQIETELVLYVLPSLPAGEPMVLVDADSLDAEEAWQSELHEGAARVVRETFSTGEDPRVMEIGTILARRRALVGKWRRSTAAVRRQMRVPERVIPESDYRKDLDKLVPTSELLEWDEMHDRLASRELEGAFVRMRERFANTVERHEVQHRVDFREGLAPLPEDIRAWLLVDDGDPLDFTGFGPRVRMETSAYLAALASTPQTSRLDLTLTTRHLFDKHEQGNPYSYAGLVILSELARELGVAIESPLIEHRHIARPTAAKVLLACAGRSDADLSAAAGRAWNRLFGHPLLATRAAQTRTNPPWRH